VGSGLVPYATSGSRLDSDLVADVAARSSLRAADCSHSKRGLLRADSNGGVYVVAKMAVRQSSGSRSVGTRW